MPVTVATETIGPKEAAEILTRNTRNRNLYPSIVDSIARDIKNGRWQFNGESIKIADTGVLLDGQNRLQAIVNAEKPVETLVVRGLSEDTQATVDTGTRRALRDVLRIEKETHAVSLASVIRADWFLKYHGRLGAFGVVATNSELIAHWEGDKDGFREAALLAVQASHSVLKIPASITGAIYHQMVTIDRSYAEEFWRLLLENEAPKRSAIWALRESLLKDLGRAHRAAPVDRAAYIIKAWNYWLQGREMDYLAWRASGPKAEPFPKLMAPVEEEVA